MRKHNNTTKVSSNFNNHSPQRHDSGYRQNVISHITLLNIIYHLIKTTKLINKIIVRNFQTT